MTNQQPVLTHWNMLQVVSIVWGERLSNNQSLFIETCCKLSVFSRSTTNQQPVLTHWYMSQVVSIFLGNTTNQQPVLTHWNLLQVVSIVWGAGLPKNQSLLIDTCCNLSALSGEHDLPTTSLYSLMHVASCQYCLGSTTNQQPVLTH